MSPDLPPLTPPPAPRPTPPAAVREQAAALESAFLAEMLRHSGLGSGEGFATLRGPFGGGIGEEQFASFLREAMARRMVGAGGIGLTESLVRALGARVG